MGARYPTDVSDFREAFNENDGVKNAMGHLAAIGQRNQQIAQHKEQAAAIRAQTAVLEQQAKSEADRAKIKQSRLEIEQQRLRADEAERQMRRQQEEQLKQLRNLIADTDTDLEGLEKKAITQSADAFLLTAASLQANVDVLVKESGALSDLSDMKALRLLKSQMTEAFESFAQQGKLPANPLGVIATRLERLDHFFNQAQSVLDRVLKFHKDWLTTSIPCVSAAELREAQEKLTEIKNTKLPQEIQRLSGLIDPTDWILLDGVATLHPEYFFCLESVRLPDFPRVAKTQNDLYLLALSDGLLLRKMANHLLDLSARIQSLLELHDEHLHLIEMVVTHNGNENLHSAARISKQWKRGGKFSDIPYDQTIQQTNVHAQHLEKIQQIHDLKNVEFAQAVKLGLLTKLIALEEAVRSKDSELGRESLTLATAIRKRAAEMKRLRKNQSLVLGAGMIVVLLGFLWLVIANAATEKKRENAVPAAKQARDVSAAAAAKARDVSIAAAAKARDADWQILGGSRAGEERVFEITDGVKLTMCWIPAGEFIMGSRSGSDEKPHLVRLTQGFWLSQTEVTQAQWRVLMGNNPSHFEGDDLPVESVSWNDICGDGAGTCGFLGKLNQLQPGRGRFDLPTEAQWEYACRAGSAGDGVGQLDAKAWFGACETNPVGQKQTNAWGLHDMQGNVCEWCADWYEEYSTGSAIDPAGPPSGSYRVLRGGSWLHYSHNCRIAYRDYYYPSYSNSYIGFRVARSSVPPVSADKKRSEPRNERVSGPNQ